MTVGKICNKEMEVIYESASIIEAAELMAEKKVGFLVVTSGDDATPTGSLTDRDIVVKGIAKGCDLSSIKVAEIMCKDLITIEEIQKGFRR